MNDLQLIQSLKVEGYLLVFLYQHYADLVQEFHFILLHIFIINSNYQMKLDFI
jgi:hypothetical protein